MTDQALAVIEKANALLEEENSFLKEGNVPAVIALLKRKEAVLAQLNSVTVECRRVAEEPGKPCCSEELPLAAEKLNLTIENNRTLLQQAMIAQRHIVQLLTASLSPPGNKTHYGKNGSYSTPRSSSGNAYRKNI
ncbi:MAG: flagellar protein FlgN [Acetobacter sp.]|uniref:flagellar protein FlgN n=1 Tax=Acetobacter sp. TaxID=440 RepID=UPI0039EB41DE